jgi:hypothetical protein
MPAVATATAQPRSARDSFFAANHIINPAPNLDATRFFVQFGWSVMQVDTICVPNQGLLRGEITPLRSTPKKASIFEIPETARIPGSEMTDPSPDAGDRRRPVYASYWLHAEHEANRLVDLEQQLDPTRKMGLYEIASLARMPQLYEQLDFNNIFFPGGLYDLPESNLEMISYLTARVPEVVKQSPPEYKEVLQQVGQEMIAAANVAQSGHLARIEFAHSCMKLSPDDKSGFYKKGYDVLDEEALLRTGVARIHDAMNATGEALKMLAAPQQDSALLQMVTALQEQNAIQAAAAARQDKLIELLMTERQEKPAKQELKLKTEK